MKAIVQDKYGSPQDVPELKEIDKPVVTDDEVLVRVRAATAKWSWDIPAAVRYIGRIGVRFRKPRNDVPGSEIAGQVEAVGTNVKQFQPGDEVFGWCKGALAEYVSVPKDQLALKPANLTFEQAAVVPYSGFTALQGLRDKGQIQPGHKVLVVGASGGVGTFAVQIAKAFRAEVTGVCSTPNLDLVRSIGADYVIDYTQEDFTNNRQKSDLILDMAGDHPLSAYRRALSPEGILVMVGSSGSTSGHLYLRGFGRWIQAFVQSVFARQQLRALITTKNQDDLVVVKELIEAGKLKPVISAHYTLHEAPKAMRHFEEGHARGKVVITV
jgi:NADPH:quinone reductase-like Zn-dependent oxidoreductase